MLKTLKLFAAFCKAEGHPIDDWTQVTKKDFDEFRSSNACISATEMDDNIALPIFSTVFKKKNFDDFRSGNACVNTTKIDDNIMLPSSSSAGQKQGDSMSGNTCAITTVNDINIALFQASSSAHQDQGDFGLTDGEAALHHVLFEVLCQPWCGPLAESLERSGFNDIQDVLVMNQAERNMLNFLNANDVLLLCQMTRRRCSLISSSSAAFVKRMASPSWTG